MHRSVIFICVGLSIGCHQTADTQNLLTLKQITAPVWKGAPYPPEDVIHPNSFELDLDKDGVPEFLIEQPMTHGNAGTNHTIYTRQSGRYKLLGELFFHRHAFRTLDPTDEYPIRAIRYWRSNASEGTLETIGYQNGKFIVLSKETIHPGDGGTNEGRQHYAELFSIE